MLLMGDIKNKILKKVLNYFILYIMDYIRVWTWMFSAGCRAVIPLSLRVRVMCLAHEGHLGIMKMKSRCRSCVW